jgi:hypothetical protein
MKSEDIVWLLLSFLYLRHLTYTQGLTFMGPCIATIFQYISNKMQLCTVYLYLKLLYMFRVLLPTIISSAYNCIYSIWYLSHRYCYLPLSWKSCNWCDCAVCGVRVRHAVTATYEMQFCIYTYKNYHQHLKVTVF